MGQKQGKEGKDQMVNSKKIDQQLQKDKMKDSEIIKLLLLGAGESGKSTLFRQMIKLYGEGFSAKDLVLFTPMIHNNTIQAMKELCLQSTQRTEAERVQTPTARASLEFMDQVNVDAKLTAEIAAHIKELWKDSGIRSTYRQRAQFQLLDSAEYFFDNVDRLATEDYVPTDTDLIRCRVRTTGIVENKFVIDENRFLMVDVGGQRNERKKWIHGFQNVTAVLYVAALSEYDQVLYEDNSTNRMDEALNLFESTCQSEWFQETSFILFLNKSDLFRSKLADTPITVWPGAETFSGDPHDFDQCVAFLEQCFSNRFLHKGQLYVHVTCATSSDNVAAVFGAVKDIIIQRHLVDSGLM